MTDLTKEQSRADALIANLTEALTLIQRISYMEGKEPGWMMAHMRGCAYAASIGESLEPYRRLFTRNNLEPKP